jgi:hypothetical protein
LGTLVELVVPEKIAFRQGRSSISSPEGFLKMVFSTLS